MIQTEFLSWRMTANIVVLAFILIVVGTVARAESPGYRLLLFHGDEYAQPESLTAGAISKQVSETIETQSINIENEAGIALARQLGVEGSWPVFVLVDSRNRVLGKWRYCADSDVLIDEVKRRLYLDFSEAERMAKSRTNLVWKDTTSNTEHSIGNECVPASSPCVYVAVNVDTEVFKLSSSIRKQALDFCNFGKDGFTAEVMASSFRNEMTDSHGGPVKFSWFVMTSEQYCRSLNSDCMAAYDALVDNWEEHIEKYGDDIQLHYHNVEWSDRDRDGDYHWNQSLRFHKANLEKMLNQLLVDRQFFPSAFRAGWTWENNEMSKFLESVIPFDFSGNPPLLRHDYFHDPVSNVFDWSEMQVRWGYYHPSESNYQLPGDMNRAVFACLSYTMFNRALDRAFIKARSEKCAMVVADYLHNTASMLPHLRSIHEALIDRSNAYGVEFVFVTASELAKIAIGSVDSLALNVTISDQEVPSDSMLTLVSSEPLFADPYVVARCEGIPYVRLEPERINDTTWTVEISCLRGSSLLGITVGACDQSGNTVVVSDSLGSIGTPE